MALVALLQAVCFIYNKLLLDLIPLVKPLNEYFLLFSFSLTNVLWIEFDEN